MKTKRTQYLKKAAAMFVFLLLVCGLAVTAQAATGKKKQKIKTSTTSVKITSTAKRKVKITGVKRKARFTVDDSSVISVKLNGITSLTITPKKNGTANIRLWAPAWGQYAKSNVVRIRVRVKMPEPVIDEGGDPGKYTQQIKAGSSSVTIRNMTPVTIRLSGAKTGMRCSWNDDSVISASFNSTSSITIHPKSPGTAVLTLWAEEDANYNKSNTLTIKVTVK